MADQLAFTDENAERILAVESFFSPAGKPLRKPGRVLVGEGCLMKLCRHNPRPRVFFLFDDILVYGSIIVPGRWYTSQQVIRLEDTMVEDLEDSPDMKNQWLIRTPRKSFYVSAISPQEKQAWVEHIEECRAKRLEQMGQAPSANFAASWIPDRASAICMRCCGKFSTTQRRHHCRQCGFVVCSTCSGKRFLIPNISRKPVRVCVRCYGSLQAAECTQKRDDGEEKYWSDRDEPVYETSSDEDRGECIEDPWPQAWASAQGPRSATPVTPCEVRSNRANFRDRWD